MSQANLPTSLWGFALETATFLLNRTPTKAVEKTSYEIWTGRKPNMSFLQIWGNESHVKRLTSDKLPPKTDKCLFMGHPKETKDTTFTTQARTKCLLLVKLFSWKMSSFPKGTVGGKYNLKKFKTHKFPKSIVRK